MNAIRSAAASGLGLVFALAGCSLIPGAPAPSLDGTWRLESGVHDGRALPIPDVDAITMAIDGSEIGGRAACNIYGGMIEIDGGRVAISALSMTEMACDEPTMAAEAAFLEALPDVETAVRVGPALILTGPVTELRFTERPEPADAELVGTAWLLESLITGDAVSSVVGDPATLRLAEDGTLTGSTGCRSFGGPYVVTGDEVRVGELAADAGACPPELQGQDQHVLAVLERFTFAIQGDRLTLTGVGGGLGLGYARDAGAG